MADIEKFVYYDNGSKKVLKPTDRIVVGSGGLAFEGSTSDDFELQLAVTDPTADRTVTFPDEDGDVALLQSDTLPKALSFPVRNPSTTTALTKGQVVYISGHSGNKPDVSLAQANSSSTMPAFGLVTADIAAEAEGYVTCVGLLKGLDTSTGYSLGDTVYVSADTAGALTTTAPTGSNLIQNIGKVTRIDASVGSILVGGAGRTAATPNLNQGKIFIGNASNQSSISAYTLPITDGTANQVLQTDGSGALSFATISSGISNLVEDTTPQLGGNLDLNSKYIVGHLLPSASNTYDIGSADYEWGDIYIANSKSIKFGISQEISLTHHTNNGLRLESNISEKPDFIVYNYGNSSITGASLELKRQATYLENNDIIGKLKFSSGTATATSDVEYAEISAKAIDTTGSDEYGQLDLNVIAQGAINTGLSIQTVSLESTPKVKISDEYYLPTADGTANQVIKTDGSGNLSFTTLDTGSFTYETKTASFGAAPNYFYDCQTVSGTTFSVTVPYSGNFSVGDRIKLFNKGTGALVIQETISGTNIDPNDGQAGAFGSFKTINSKALVELIAVSSSTWSYVIIPQLELDDSSLTSDGEVFAYNTTDEAMKPLPYTFPVSDGSANRVLSTNGNGQLSFVDQPSTAPAITYTKLDTNKTFAAYTNYVVPYAGLSSAVTLTLPLSNSSSSLDGQVFEIVNNSGQTVNLYVSDRLVGNYLTDIVYNGTNYGQSQYDGAYTVSLPASTVYKISIQYYISGVYGILYYNVL